MASDQDYMDFLNKANSDVGGGAAKSSTEQQYNTSSVDTSVPPKLQGVKEYYTSDADEPFEPVAIKWQGDGQPSAEDLARLTGTKGKVSSITQQDFDPRGQYKKVIQLVEGEGNGGVAFFRVDVSATRVEYYIVTVADGTLVGLKAKAVES